MKRFLKHLSFSAFRLGCRLGVFVLPTHYYASVANPHQLEKTRDAWSGRSELPGIRVDLDDQIAILRQTCVPYQAEYTGNSTYLEAVDQQFGPGYGFVEAQALHGIVRHHKPKRIVEVGSGVSTACMIAAAERNRAETGIQCKITCVEPFPSPALLQLGGIELIRTPVQTVDMSLFSALGRGDLLFIDSSHTVKPGSDVNFLVLEVLPRLAPGVIVHVHDIYLPYDYPRDVLTTYFQWMETSLLRAFMTQNDHVRTLFCLSHLHYDRPDMLREVFPEYVPADNRDGLEVANSSSPGHFPASIFLEIT